MEKPGRYRSYTLYSEENGRLVPSIEPQEKWSIIDITTGHVYATEKEKLKSDIVPNNMQTQDNTLTTNDITK